ncbi:hypothetical protein GIB67_002537 [Kingdonia uniflora]|uniref:Aminotransferase-like plant mobile domain-containing protein n=1 Tax=Kingdonia uniflora TaxID=39325 RepID=A0A7J7N938_9MAGN|nr:hypothetical protein GIB67_002537 [Kingdonia uniflora]
MEYTINEKVPPTASNRRKRELTREGDLLIYKRKIKTIDPSTIVPPNTADTSNEGVSKPVPPTESAQATLGAQAESAQAEKLPIRIHYHQSTWDLTKEPQVVQDFVKLKGLDRIGAISYNYFNFALIFAFAERWQPKTNSFHFKWGEMTPTLDDVEQLVGLPTDGDAMVIGGTWGFPAILEVFENNFLHDLNAFKSLKAKGAGNSLSLRKLKEHYAYKLEKVLSDGTAAAAKKKKGLTARSVARAYMLYVLGSFLFPMKRVHMSAHGIISRDDGKQFACCTTLLEFPKLAGIPNEMDSDAYEHCTCWKWDVSIMDRYGDTTLLKFREALDNYKLEDHHEHASLSLNAHDTMPTRGRSAGFDQQITELNDQLQKLKEDKEKESEANTKLRESLKEKTSECNLLKEIIKKMKEDIQLKHVVDEQCALEFADLPRQLDAKILEYTNLKAKNTSLEAELRQKFSLEDSCCAIVTSACAKHNPSKERKKLANAEELMKSLKVNNSEWVWRQSLKKAFASEGMRDMGDPTFKEFFEQNKRLFIIAQQGPKGDYQEDLVSTAVTLKNVVIARREKMAKKKKIQELLFQPWTKYLVDVRGIKISDNNFGFRVTAAIQHQSQHRFPDVMKSLKTFLYKDPAFWKSIFSQTLGIQFTPDGDNAYQILLQACSYGHQHVEYRHMTHLLSTYYEKIVVFISHTEAYTFLPLF